VATITAPPPFLPLTRSDQSVRLGSGVSAYRLVITYVLLLPLLFFAVRGNFSFEYASQNTAEMGIYGAEMMVNYGKGSILHSLELLFYYGIIGMAMLPFWRQVAAASLQNKLSFLLPLWAMLSMVWSQEPKRSLAFATLVLINTFFAVYLSVRFKPKQQLQIFLLAGIIATVGSFILLAVMPKAAIDHKNQMIGVEGIYPHKNICGVITALFMLPAFFYKFSGKSASLKRALYLLAGSALIAISTSRTGWLVFAACVSFVYLSKLLRRLRSVERLLVVLFVPSVLASIGWLVYSFRGEILALLHKSPTLSGRTQVWHIVFLSIFKRPILGFGYDAFWLGFKGEVVHMILAAGARNLTNAENAILQLWLEVGLVGVFLILAMLFQGCRNAIKCFRSDTPNYALWYMSMLFLEILALGDGQRYMIPHSIEWTILVLANAGLAMEAKRVQALASI
jgi:exopolysaccharide production protein ExoQ